jgi:S-(hydroxymethyl)glutathione dehydrogenase/alcohol dehydrogenase
VAGAVIAGCAPVIAVDVLPEKLAAAKAMGASEAVNAAESDPVEAVLRLCPGGADFAIEATGRPKVMQQALACVRGQGGVAVIVGNARHGERLELDPRQLNQGKQLRGTWGGDNWPDRDFPRYCKLLASNKLSVTPLLSKPYPLGEINQAIDDLESGEAVRPLVEMTSD